MIGEQWLCTFPGTVSSMSGECWELMFGENFAFPEFSGVLPPHFRGVRVRHVHLKAVIGNKPVMGPIVI